jgi:hypothetical protein
MKKLVNEFTNMNSKEKSKLKVNQWPSASFSIEEPRRKKRIRSNNYKLKSAGFTLVLSIILFSVNTSIAQVQTEKASNHSVLTRQFNMIMEKAMLLKSGNTVNKMDQENIVKDIDMYLNESNKQLTVISEMTPNFKRENESMKKHQMKAKEHLKELKTEIEKAIPDQSKIKSHASELYNEIEKAQEDHKELKMKAEK